MCMCERDREGKREADTHTQMPDIMENYFYFLPFEFQILAFEWWAFSLIVISLIVIIRINIKM